ncbi:hypothetical protein RHGRI_004371 [Rhododendron griersonianum]|uniref:Protein kinase domain-containing protein n=1 Tax=Rhododendron griersonianum TaxID=479676 RepID=A0AAV6L962_9ERIC|nr:hypothetical protein RHGRI_004371 [Rhododendron griersonianum]
MEIIYVVELVSPLGEWRQDGNNLRDGVNHEENPPLPTSSGISLSTQLPPPGSGDHLLQPPLETKLLEGKVYGSLARAGKADPVDESAPSKNAEESAEHFLLHCNAAWRACSRIIDLWHMQQWLCQIHITPHVMLAGLLIQNERRGLNTLKESCPSVLTELLQYVARISEHSAIGSSHGNESFPQIFMHDLRLIHNDLKPETFFLFHQSILKSQIIRIAWLGGYSGVLKLQVGLRISEHSAISSSHGNKAFLDGSDLNSRHVKHLQ